MAAAMRMHCLAGLFELKLVATFAHLAVVAWGLGRLGCEGLLLAVRWRAPSLTDTTNQNVSDGMGASDRCGGCHTQ